MSPGREGKGRGREGPVSQGEGLLDRWGAYLTMSPLARATKGTRWDRVPPMVIRRTSLGGVSGGSSDQPRTEPWNWRNTRRSSCSTERALSHMVGRSLRETSGGYALVHSPTHSDRRCWWLTSEAAELDRHVAGGPEKQIFGRSVCVLARKDPLPIGGLGDRGSSWWGDCQLVLWVGPR